MIFEWPSILWLEILLPVLILLYVLAQRRRQKYALRFASLSLVKDALGKGPGILRHIPPVFFLLGIGVMIFAMARPSAMVILPVQQGTVILTIDVSGSMRAEDMKPNRLEAAKEAARVFVSKQKSSVRIGIVAFSDNAAIVQAPTTDRESILQAINRLSPQRGTAIGSGLLTSIDAIYEVPVNLQARPAGAQSFLVPTPTPSPTPLPRGTYAPAVVILLSDGVSNRGPNPVEVIPVAVNRGVRVFTVGLGSPDGTVLNIQGRSIRVRLDEAILKKIAADTDADYFRADTETDLQKVYERLSTELVMKPEKTELTALFTAGAMIFFLIAGFLSLLWFNRLP